MDEGGRRQASAARVEPRGARSMDLVARVDAELRYVYVSATLERRTGAPRAALLGARVGATHASREPSVRDLDAVLESGMERAVVIDALEHRLIPEADLDGRVLAVSVLQLERERRERGGPDEQARELELLHALTALVDVHDGDPHELVPRLVELYRHHMRAGICIDVEGRRHGDELAGDVVVAPIRIAEARIGRVALATRSDRDARLARTLAAHLSSVFRRAARELELGARGTYFRALIESSSDAIAVASSDGLPLYVSPPVRDLLGWTPDEILDGSAFPIVHPDDREERERALARVVEQGTARTELRLQHRDGTHRTMDIIMRNLLHDPHVRGIVTSIRDLSGRRLLEQQLRQAQKMEAIGRLAGGVAHDFNNLLTVISVNAEMLLADLSDADERQAAEAEQILEAAHRGTALTRQLLAFSRRRVVQPSIVDLCSVVSGMEKMLNRLIGEDVVLDTQLPPIALPVLADAGTLEQALLNLVLNARDAMPNGGRVEVRCAAHGDSAVSLIVRDEGEGMEPAVVERIFDPFFTTKANGTGLGLPTVCAAVQQAGGEVRVESTPGRGTTFTVQLPRARGVARAAPASIEGGLDVAPARETILVVEDELMVRRIACDILRRRGYRVLEAADGPAALQIARAHPGSIDLLLTDVVMPSMSGRELAEALLAERADLAVLYMSGHNDEARTRHGVRERRVLFKPFTSRVLSAAVRRALDEQAATSEHRTRASD